MEPVILPGARKALVIFFALLTCACASPGEQAAKARAEAEGAFLAGNYEAARDKIHDALSYRDDITEYWTQLGRLNLLLNEPLDAYAAYARALELDQGNIESLQALARIALMSRSWDLAEDYAATLLILSPRNATGIVVQGLLAQQRGDNEEALGRANDILRLNPADESALILKARALFDMGNPGEAVDTLERSLDVSGPSRPKLEELIRFYQRMGNPSAQIKSYRRLLQVAPGDVGVRADLARILLSREAYRPAVDLLSGLMAQPLKPVERRRVASVLLAADEKAIPRDTLLRLARKAHPNLQSSLAGVALEKGYYREAAKLLEPMAGQEVSSANSAVVAMYAAAQYHLGRPGLAEEIAAKVLAFDPFNPRALLVRANISLDRSDFGQAMRDAQILVREQPSLDTNRALLAKVYLARGQPALALLTYRRAYNDLPRSQLIAREYSMLLREEDGDQAAITVLREFTAKNPKSVSAWRALEEMCSSAGREECSAHAKDQLHQSRPDIPVI